MVVKKMEVGKYKMVDLWSENGDQNDGRCEGCCEVRCGDGGEGGAVGGGKHKYFPSNGHITPVKSTSEVS